MTSRDDRKAALRRILVDRVHGAQATRTRPWRLAALLSAVAIAGVATGAASAAALSQPAPYDDASVSSLALSVARPNSVAVGAPFYVTSDDEVSVDIGARPAVATGVAMRTRCVDAGETTISLDGTWIGSFSCDDDGGGGGWVEHVTDGQHTLTFDTSEGGRFESWIVWVEEPPMPESSRHQKLEMADGVATREEYIAAFSRFAGCMNAEGFDVLGDVTDDVVFDYGITDEAERGGAYELCYVSQFEDVDMAWQLQNEATSDSTRILRECLVANGITPSDDFRQYSRQLEDAAIDLAVCAP